MKRLFLLLFCAITMVGASYGYQFDKYPGIGFQALSPDGKWLLTSDGYYAIAYNPSTEEYYYHESEDYDESYSWGYGNCVNSLGMAVGECPEGAAVWQGGVWTVLPMPEGYETGLYPVAHGITADGKYICGNFYSGSTLKLNGGQMYFPVIWTKGDDGNYGAFEFLPCPEKDFTGRIPQYVTALSISDDGATVVGQVMSANGRITYPIVYTKAADGTWSYKLYGLDEIVEPGTVFPEYPEYEPEYPSVDDFISADSLTSYNNAMTAREDSVALFNSGAITDYPSYYPSKRDFLGRTELYEYGKAMGTYEKEYELYNDSVNAWYEVYESKVTGASYTYNTVTLSANGKYFGQTLSADDPNADPFDYWSQSTIDCPVLFDLSNDGKMTKVEATSMTVATVTNSGMMTACSPSMEYTRQAYIVPAGETKPVLFYDWVKAKADTAAVWLKENMSYDVYSEYDDDGNPANVVEDSVIAGTMVCNPEGTIFCGYIYDYWTLDETNAGYNTFVMDITDLQPSGIRGLLSGKETSLSISAAEGTITVSGNVADVRVYDAAGRIVGGNKNGSAISVNNGLYIVKAVDANGKTVTKKVRISK